MDGTAEDPGWRPAVALALRPGSLRTSRAPIITVLRAIAVLLASAAALSGLITALFGGGTGTPQVDEITANLLGMGSVGVAAVATVAIGRGGPPSGPAFAAWAFQTLLRRMVAVVLLGPVGLALSSFAADPVWIVYGSAAAVVLIAVVGPTVRRLEAWQEDVDEGFSVLEALMAPYA